ncbi:hypothetical protein Btru_049657 [Bulinus truncatus]|nr:hypothetical protein Btru_049657 [Bulinus truncatus]
MTTQALCSTHDLCSQSEISEHMLKVRLDNADTDTQLLIQQLEEMGFTANSDSNKEYFVKKNGNTNNSGQYSHVKNITFPGQNKTFAKSSKYLEVNTIPSHGHEQKKDDDMPHAHQVSLSKSTKHQPVTPLSLHEIGSAGITEESPDISKSVMYHRNVENVLKNKMTKAEGNIGTISRQELEQELLRLRKLLSQVEEELQKEIHNKKAAREEVKYLKSVLDKSNIAKTELEMKVEELNASKHKLSRRLGELKDEATRESNLRASLEESHASLLARLQDMEVVIESLRSECRTHSTGSSGLKSELLSLKSNFETEKSRRELIEKNYLTVKAEKDRLLQSASDTQAENKKVSYNLTQLQTQYTELIRQLEQTQVIIDNLTTDNKQLEEDREDLQKKVKNLTLDLEKLVRQKEEYIQIENRIKMENNSLAEDLDQKKAQVEKIVKENIDKNKQIETLEHELRATKQSLSNKNQEFMTAADNLEFQLSGVKSQLEAMENEKQNVMKDKENLLEEVNQTMDSLIAERSRLQSEVQASKIETESLRSTCSKLEQDKVLLLERLGALQHQQVTQRKIEDTLNDMMEHKNKLAYENGKLQSTINQLQQEIAELMKNREDTNQLKKLNQTLKAKYNQCQQELSEYKISLQTLESQRKMVINDLAQRDSALKTAMARKEEAENEKRKMMAQLEVLEGRQLHKVSNYQKSMEEAKIVNKEIANTLEAVMASHSQLQKIVENLQTELGKRDSQINQLKTSRNRESETMKQEMKKSEEQLEALKVDLRKEREKSGKKIAKEISEMRRQNENLSDRNQELAKLNIDLRNRVAEMEREKEDMKSKLADQRQKMEYLNKGKKQLEDNLNRMKAAREDIDELERMRNEYMKKNREQGETIEKFMSQISLLQDEMRQLANAHINAQQLLKMKEDALEKERKIREEMRKRYSESLKREDELNKKSHVSDEKLREAHNESQEISKHLEEAHEWFRGKFDKLQSEITTSKQIQAKLVRENMDQRNSLEVERSKAMDAAERAKEMIQNSRQTISRLADYAQLADVDTKQQLADLRAELLITPTPSKLAILHSDKENDLKTDHHQK